MIAGADLKKLTQKKIKTIKHLINVGEWEVAAYLMGYVLEFALKAASCKALKLGGYPPVKNIDGKEAQGFKTHEFQQLLIVSGLSDLFGNMTTTKAYENWSFFTISYPGNWTEMRYFDETEKFNVNEVTSLSKSLYDDPDSIIKTIRKKRRW